MEFTLHFFLHLNQLIGVQNLSTAGKMLFIQVVYSHVLYMKKTIRKSQEKMKLLKKLVFHSFTSTKPLPPP